MIIYEKLNAQAELPHLGSALKPLCPAFGFAEGWEQHSGENSDDRNDDEKLDQSECVLEAKWSLVLLSFHGGNSSSGLTSRIVARTEP